MVKQQLQRGIWLLVGLWYVMCSVAGQEDLRPLHISIRTEEPTNLYYDTDTVAIQSAVIVSVTIENNAVAEFKGSYSYHIVDYWGERVARSRRSVSLGLAPGGRVVRKEAFQVSRRGPYVFIAQVRRGREEITEALPFAIIPQPKERLHPDSFFGVQANAADARATAFLKHLGVSLLRAPEPTEKAAETAQSPLTTKGPNLRASAFARSVDRRVQRMKRQGEDKPLTIEVGEIGDSLEDRRAAPKLVAQHVVAALAGAYRVAMAAGTVGPEQVRESAAYATMVSLLDGRAPVWDLFPTAPNLWGAVFAAPSIVDPEMHLPRKETLSVRWRTAGDPRDATKVAVLWSYIGADAHHIDSGTLVVEDGKDIEALDLFGNPVGERQRARLSVPVGEAPVYLVSRLPVQTFAERIASARLEGLTPIALQVLPLTEPPDRARHLVVRVQNQLNRPISGTLTLDLPIGWSVQPPQHLFTLEMGELKDIAFDIAGAVANRENIYPIAVTAEVDKKRYERTQLVQVAAAVHGTVQVDGDLSDWADAYPLYLDSAPQFYSQAYARSLFNPARGRFTPPARQRHIAAQVYAKWDTEYFYFAAEVVEPEFAPAAADPPAGIEAFWNGDAVQLAFSLHERAEDDDHAADDPWRWKGAFRDTEYGFLIVQTPNGPGVVRLFAPETPFGAWDAAAKGPHKMVKGAQAVVRRSDAEGKTYYEAAIPLAAIGGLQPQDGQRVRCGFVLHNNEGIRRGRLQWSEVAGVWDDFNNVGSFLPSDEPFLPCQTVWGFVGATLRFSQKDR